MKNIFLSIVMSILFVGCATTTGTSPKSSISNFDGSKTVSVMPHGAACTSMICSGVGAVWNSKHPELVALNIVVYNQTVGINSASFNIDGKIVNLKNSQITDFENNSGITESKNTYITNLSIIDDILNSKRTWVRISTSKGNVEDAIIDGDKDSKAFHALKRFKNEMKAAK